MSQAATEFTKKVEIFIFRDSMYIVGGLSVLVTFLFVFDRFPRSLPLIFSENIILFQIYLILISYPIGYVFQELFSLSPIVTTAVRKPNSIQKALIRRFERKSELGEWTDWRPKDYERITMCVESDFHRASSARQRRERIINLTHVGTTLGSNLLLVTFLLAGMLLIRPSTRDVFMTVVVISIFLFSIALLFTAWIKLGQQYRIEMKLHMACDEDHETYIQIPDSTDG